MSNRMSMIAGAMLTCAIAGTAIFLAAGCPPTGGNVLSESFDTTAGKPTVDVPDDLTVECDGSGNQEALKEWLNSATYTPGCGGAKISNDFVTFPYTCGASGEVTVTWTVTDRCGASVSDSA